MSKEAELYVPSIAGIPEDLKLRYDLLQPARERDFRTDLMLVLRGPRDLERESIQKQLDNLDSYVGKPREERPSVFVMHPSVPLEGPHKLNFLTNPDWSQEYVEKSVELVAKLPPELAPSTGRALSFHLNTIITPDQWIPDEEYWAKAFEEVLRRIRDISEYGKRQNVNIALETTPIPEYGDEVKTKKSLLADGKTYWSDLGNPWPLLFWRDEITRIRESGAQMAIDFCHSYIALRTVREVARLVKEGKHNALSTYMLFGRDIENVSPLLEYSESVKQNTNKGDIWHVNDAREIYRTPELQGEQSYFQEGIALFEGDIPVEALRRLIRSGLDKPIKFVIEVNEEDFTNSPNTRKSLARVLEQSKDKGLK